MNIRGICKSTLIDYPGHIASIIFVGGCNMNCVYCHNSFLIEKGRPIITEDEMLEELKTRKLIEALVISGGEPTCAYGLFEFLRRVKELDLKVKIETNGSNPVILKNLISEKLVDCVAMDIKTSLSKYREITRSRIDVRDISNSVDLLMTSGIEYEFHTTVVGNEEYHNDQVFHDIGTLIKDADIYYLQPYQDVPQVPMRDILIPPTYSQLYHYQSIMQSYVKKVNII